MKHIAIILARGGSKRIPRKNIINFYDKPMIAWTIEAALQSEQFEKVLVSTDDEEIAEISLSFGAEVPFLRETANDDLAASSQATISALNQAEHYWGESYNVVSQLMANCPLRDATNIYQSVQNFIKKEVESQISSFLYGWMNPWWAAQLDKQGKPNYLFPEARKSRSQDLSPLYCPSGAIWTSLTKVLKTEKTFYSKNHIFHLMDWMSAMDIDELEDLEMAKACFVLKNNNLTNTNS